MQQDKTLVVVGGAGRNVGKTEFTCRLIEKISRDHEVYGLKVSAIFPNELTFHGSHGEHGLSRQIFEEFCRDSRKDTSRMLRAGASRVFFICCENEDVFSEYAAFRKELPEDALLVCESNSLATYVKPALDIMVVPRKGEIKPRAAERIPLADLVVQSDGKNGFPQLAKVAFDQASGWHIL